MRDLIISIKRESTRPDGRLPDGGWGFTLKEEHDIVLGIEAAMPGWTIERIHGGRGYWNLAFRLIKSADDRKSVRGDT
jgi:hypothetical protein